MAFNFMQSLIDNLNLESLDTANDNSDESDIDLDFKRLNQDFEELIESCESTDSVHIVGTPNQNFIMKIHLIF